MILPSQNFIDIFKGTPGALSVCESIAIINIAAQAPEGIYAELGTHKGKSAMSAMYGLGQGYFYLLDPIFEDDLTMAEVYNKLIPFSIKRQIIFELVPEFSTDFFEKEFFKKIEMMFSYVFVDSGSHGDGIPMQEVKLLEDRIMPGGIIAFHDYLNQFVEVEGAYNYLLSTGKYDVIPINWQEIFNHVVPNNLEQGNESWHQYPELPHPPNFVGALKRK